MSAFRRSGLRSAMLAKEMSSEAVAATAQPWWRGAAIYQIYPRSFADSNDDGIGDLPGITGRLDYVASLGVDGIWLSPFYTSPMRDFGYDVADYCGVDPMFGTIGDFDVLLERAHALGLKVVIDQVYSHTSDQHAWFQESRSNRTNPKADWYVWADAKADGSPPNNWQSVFAGPAWSWDARRGQYYLHNFLPQQPDLNLHDPTVQAEILKVAGFWLDRGVDGFRMDAINFAMHDPELRDNPPARSTKGRRPFDFQQHLHNQSHPDIVKFLAKLRVLTDSYPGRFTLAEVGGEQSLSEMRAYTQGDDRLNSAYGFDFLYADRLTPELVAGAIGAWPEGEGVGWPTWAFENHDAPRAISRWASGTDQHELVRTKTLLLCCLRGSIILYQGEELGLPQVDLPYECLRDPEAIANWPETLGRDGARTAMPWRADAPNLGFSKHEPWLSAGETHRPLSVDRQESRSDSMLQFTRSCLRLRSSYPALRQGSIRLIEAGERLLVFERVEGQQRIRCAFNLSESAVAAPAQGRPIIGVGDFEADQLGPFASRIEQIG